MRPSRKHTDVGIPGEKSHSYYTTVNAKKYGRNFFPLSFVPNCGE